MKYKIDYEHGIATLYTPSLDWEDRFEELAGECFGIRKSIGKTALLETTDEKPPYLLVDEYERLEHHGDVIVWNDKGEKIKSEWDF